MPRHGSNPDVVQSSAKKRFRDDLARAVERGRKAIIASNTAQTAMSCLDFTSLNDGDTAESITALCDKALLSDVSPAAVCVYPQFIETAIRALQGSDIKVATVINFPYGHKTNAGEMATPDNTRQAILEAIQHGVDEIDIVVDYQSWKMDMDDRNARALLRACREACAGDVKMKVILETAAIDFENEIYDLACLAIEEGADMIKTSTGKHESGGATLPAVAAMAMALSRHDHAHQCGLKVSGGVKSVQDCAAYMAVIRHVLGDDFVRPDRFRIGASGVFDALTHAIKPITKGAAYAPKSPASNY